MSDLSIREIFLAAIELQGDDLASYLDRACGDDEALRSEVESLLESDRRIRARSDDHSTTPFHRDPPSGARSDSAAAYGPDVGESIDGFRILELIGEGGMGLVYLAEQLEPVKRRIALKVIKPGMDSKAVLARFEAERQALALMDHPGIARVLQAGTTERGLPYFAMEYVKGVPITEAADRHQLDTGQRLALMMKVCDAVQHAHQKGIIHRDLKPTNILVTTGAGDELVAKIIDFGVAKATTQPLTDLTVHTQIGHFIGTPAYMSPEQADLTAADIDTRTDVYSLGVILYELLTGQLPFDPGELREAGLDEMRRKIREDDPPKPSTRLTGLDDDTATRISKARRTRLDQLQRHLASELDWIPLKAMRKMPADRYATPTDLARDLQRYLEGEPLEAGPESTGYRLRKFIGRRRVPIAVGSVLAAMLLVATGVSLWFAIEASKARTDAEARARDLEALSAFQAAQLGQVDPELMGVRLREDLRSSVTDTLERLQVSDDELASMTREFEAILEGTDFTGLASNSIDRNLLVPTIEAIDVRFDDKPVIQARLLEAVAATGISLGEYERSIEARERATSILERVMGPVHPDSIGALGRLGAAYRLAGSYSEARDSLEEALARARNTLDPDDPVTLEILVDHGVLDRTEGRSGVAGDRLEAAMTGLRRVHGSEHPLTQRAIAEFAEFLQTQGRYAEARVLLEENRRMMRNLHGDDHLDSIRSAADLADLLTIDGAYAEALDGYLDLVPTARRVLGDEHPMTLRCRAGLARCYRQMDQLQKARSEYEEVIRDMTWTLGASHHLTNRTKAGLASLYSADGNPARAVPLYEESLAWYVGELGDDHPETLQIYNNLGQSLRKVGRHEDSIVILEGGLERALSSDEIGPDHQATIWIHNSLGDSYREDARFEKAEEQLVLALAGSKRLHGEAHRDVATAHESIGRLLFSWEKIEDACGHFRIAYEISRNTLGPEHSTTGIHKRTLDVVLGLLVDRYRTRDAKEPGQGHGATADRYAAEKAALEG